MIAIDKHINLMNLNFFSAAFQNEAHKQGVEMSVVADNDVHDALHVPLVESCI